MNASPDAKLGATAGAARHASADAAPAAPLSAADLVRRRRAARRLAWGLALLVLALYLGGMFFKR
jgi:hypothetical protein